MLDSQGLGGLTPSGASQPPKFSLTPTGLVKNTSKIHCWPLSGFTTNRVLSRGRKTWGEVEEGYGIVWSGPIWTIFRDVCRDLISIEGMSNSSLVCKIPMEVFKINDDDDVVPRIVCPIWSPFVHVFLNIAIPAADQAVLCHHAQCTQGRQWKWQKDVYIDAWFIAPIVTWARP